METDKLTEAELKEFVELVERQNRLEKEMGELRTHVEKEIERLRSNINESHRKTYSKIEEVATRMSDYEREILDVKNKLEVFSTNVNQRMLGIDGNIQNMEGEMKDMKITLGSIDTVMKTMSESQRELIKVQNSTIKNLWRAFFAVLTVITTASGIIFALIGLQSQLNFIICTC